MRKSPREEIAHYRELIRKFTPPRSERESRLIGMLEFLIEETRAQLDLDEARTPTPERPVDPAYASRVAAQACERHRAESSNGEHRSAALHPLKRGA